MMLLSLLLTALVMPVAAAICFGVQAVARRLGLGSPAERITGADRRWLARQHINLGR